MINTLKKYDGKNIIIDNPEKNISIYEYLDVIDILLTYGSTTLVDFSLLGVPMADSDLNKLQISPMAQVLDYFDSNEYFEKINYALKNEILKFLKKYFRWFIWTNLFDTLNISKQIKKLKEKNFYNLVL